MVSPQAIAEEFATTYYPLCKTDRSALSIFYHDDSSLVWQGHTFTGKENIVNGLVGLNLSEIVPNLQTLVGEEGNAGSVTVSAVGSLVINDEPNARQFWHKVVLKRHNEGMYIFREVFTLSQRS